ncbi:MAG TPA: hypothetical protein PL037_06810, partial [Elusimicrobiales bacterium]|nr:hypothetical protein [Elusimicrobiales bacterium]
AGEGGGASGAATRLAGSAGFLKSAGAAAPSWSAVTLSGSDVTGTLGSSNGGTGNAYTKFSGPSGTEKTFTLPNASATILTSNSAVTVPQGGTGQTTLTSGSVIIGNGANAVSFVAGVASASFDVVVTTTPPAQCVSLSITSGVITAVGAGHDCSN